MNGERAVSPKVARILIADDHALVREGLRTMLSGEEGLEVIAEAKDGQQAPDCRWKRFVVRGRARSETGEADLLTSEGLIGPKRADKPAKQAC